MTRPKSELDAVLALLSPAALRPGSVIATIYGDAILARGGSLALADLIKLMARLGASDGVVRTAVSRLTKDRILQGTKHGRHSAYSLTTTGRSQFQAAIPKIYGPGRIQWDGQLRLAFPEPGESRPALDQAGFATIIPGVLVSPFAPAPNIPVFAATADRAAMTHLAARAWPLPPLATRYGDFITAMTPLLTMPTTLSLDAMAARIALIHSWRRIALRDPNLPMDLLPDTWPGQQARTLCIAIYTRLLGASEAWLDTASSGQAALSPGCGPINRFDLYPA